MILQYKFPSKQISEKDIKKYLKSVKKHLYCDGNNRKDIINRVHHFILDYITENSNADMSDLETDFGSPESVADEQMDNFTLDSKIRFQKIRRKRKWLYILVIAIFILSILIGCVYLLKAMDVTIVHEGPVIRP